MKVFISSVIRGYENYRDAAADAVQMLGHEAVRAERFPADPDAPQQVCLREVREADLVVLLMGGRYGFVAPSGLSATHEEYREARERHPIFVLLEQGIERETQQQEFVAEVQSYVSGHYMASFSSENELRQGVVRALHDYELSVAAGSVDESELLQRAERLIPGERGIAAALLSLAIAAGPSQQVLRPTEIEDPKLAKQIMQQALFGDAPLLDSDQGTQPRMEGSALVIEQNSTRGWIRIDELGTIGIVVPARRPDRNDPMASLVIVEEDVRQRLGQMLQFAGWLLDKIDPLRRLCDGWQDGSGRD